jgi:hypothetical protein
MNDSLSLLIAEFRNRAERADDLFLLSATAASDFVQRGRDLNLRLVGVEGFRKTEAGAFQPKQEFSNDLADFVLDNDEFVRNTLELIEKGGAQGLLFQVVFE